MTLTLLLCWLVLALVGIPVLYMGYGFVTSAMRARDAKVNPSPDYVVKVDSVISTFFILLDGLLNVLVFPFLCLDFRPSMAFRLVTVKGYTFPWLELVTERLSRYNEDPTEWPPGRFVARLFAPFLDAKDPKGWHVRPAPKL